MKIADLRQEYMRAGLGEADADRDPIRQFERWFEDALRARLPLPNAMTLATVGADGPRGKDFNMRWVASMVADVFRVLSRGGIFMYPRDSKQKEGRLRLMYEANPMAFIVEQAGGAATDGRGRILDIQPKGLHQKVAVILGSRHEVERVSSYHQ